MKMTRYHVQYETGVGSAMSSHFTEIASIKALMSLLSGFPSNFEVGFYKTDAQGNTSNVINSTAGGILEYARKYK